MDSYKNIGNLMGFFGIQSNPSLASFYNDVLAKGENQNLDMRGATWGRLQKVPTYEVLERYNDVEVMATFVDMYSDPRAIGGGVKFNKYTGSIPRHKAIVTLDEVDVTEKKYELQSLANFESNFVGDMEEWLYTKLSAIPKAHKNTINYMLGQLKSKLDFELTVANNPQGIKGLKFPSHVPEANRKETKFWTIEADGKVTYNNEVNPVEYIQNLVQDIKEDPYHGYDTITLEMNAKTFKLLMKHPIWAKNIAYALDNSFYKVAGNDDNAVAYGRDWLTRNKLEAKIDIFKQICEIDEVLLSEATTAVEVGVKQDGVAPFLDRPKMQCFDEGRMLLRPSGNIIKIIPVEPNRVDDSAIISTDIFGGRGLIEYWYEPREKVATWRSELTCLPVFTAPSQIYNVSFVDDKRVATLSAGAGTPVATVKKTSTKA